LQFPLYKKFGFEPEQNPSRRSKTRLKEFVFLLNFSKTTFVGKSKRELLELNNTAQSMTQFS
jgi:hypothetical protein